MRSPSITRRVLIAVIILITEFAVLEAGLRVYGVFEGTTTFSSLFMDDPEIGPRLRPNARIRYTTAEFTADIAINQQGVRDEEPIGPKPAGERRIVVLGDSLVLSVQVAFDETFCERLERRLNESGAAGHWRVINAGVQGYGPVQEWLLFDKVAAAFEPDIVLVVPFVANDATDAADAVASLEAGRVIKTVQPSVQRIRRIVRSSVVLQSVRVRWDQLRSHLTMGTPERPLASYLIDPPPVITQGLDVSRRAIEKIAGRASGLGARTAIALMPARFQTNDPDYQRLEVTVRHAGGVLDRDSASRRFHDALAPLQLPMTDLQTILAGQSDREGLFYQQTVHLTPRGHKVVADALFDFLQSAGLLQDRAR